MKNINRDLLPIIKDMPQSDISLDIITIDGRQYYKYNVSFIVDQIASYTSGVRSMNVDVAYRNIGKTFTLLSGKNLVTSSEINNHLINLGKIRRDFVNQRDKQQKDSTILSRKVDLFSRSIKTSLFRLKQTGFIDLVAIETTNVAVADSVSSKDQVSDLIKNFQPKSSLKTGNLIYSELTLKGSDPAAKISTDNAIQDGPRVRRGMMPTNRILGTIAGSFSTQQNSTGKNNNLVDQLKSNLIQVPTSNIKIPYTFLMSTSDEPPEGKIYLLCTIRAENGDLIQKINFTINHEKQTVKYSIPKRMPSVAMQPVNNTTMQVNIFNQDERISGVRIYARDVPSYQSLSSQKAYEKVGSISINNKQQTITQKVKIKTGNSKLLRALPVLKNGTILGNFASTAIPKPKGDVSGTVIAISDKSVVTITVYETPAAYMYVQFVRKNLTKHQKTWEPVQLPIKLGLGLASIKDYNVRPGHTYEYAAILHDKYGNMSKARGTSIIAVQDYASGTELTTSVVDTKIDGGSTTTTFNINVKLAKDADISSILAATKTQGIDEYFASETKKLSGDLNSITKVNVKRVSQDTGEIKDLGVVEPGSFTDTTDENVVYIFEGLLRSQADLFEETGAKTTSPKVLNPRDAFQRGKIVSSTLSSNQQISNPNFTQKFLSKKSLLRGTLAYGNTKTNDEESSGFLQGRLGITSTVDVARTSNDYTIDGFNLIVADAGHRLLQFNVSNLRNQKNIDFFIISIIRGGIKSVVGTCHYIDNSRTQNFLDDKTHLTTGNIAYIVTPVRYDGSTGNEAVSQQFEVI